MFQGRAAQVQDGTKSMMPQGYQLPNSQNVLAQRAGMMMQPRPQMGMPMQAPMQMPQMQPHPMMAPQQMPQFAPENPQMATAMPQMQARPQMGQPMMNPQMQNPQLMQNIARQRMMGVM
jgi:hypothetical protein